MYVNIDIVNIMFLGLFVIRRKKILILNGVVSVYWWYDIYFSSIECFRVWRL